MTSYDARIRIKGHALTLETMEGLPDGTFVLRGSHAGDGTSHVFRVEHLNPEGHLTNSADTIHNDPEPEPAPTPIHQWAPPPEALRKDDFGAGYLPAPEPLIVHSDEPAPAETEAGSPDAD